MCPQHMQYTARCQHRCSTGQERGRLLVLRTSPSGEAIGRQCSAVASSNAALSTGRSSPVPLPDQLGGLASVSRLQLTSRHDNGCNAELLVGQRALEGLTLPLATCSHQRLPEDPPPSGHRHSRRATADCMASQAHCEKFVVLGRLASEGPCRRIQTESAAMLLHLCTESRSQARDVQLQHRAL